ncbi:zinc-dependent alcohol dehydrogenase [Bradyrhizobium sp. BR 1432]|uniref:zinc-dependent alcohol dehydrogenase n=1 Tax=Bradyrhizobium sp. BR 1432 TaxID=3447966 RepID=UPI003EE5DC73
MRAAVLQDIRDIRVLDIPEPRPVAEDDLIVRVKAVGVCGSDLHSYLEGGTTGPTRVKPFVLGHEFSGVLTPDSARKAGLSADALVAVDPSIPCGHCEWCHRGHTNLCPNVKFLGYAPHNGAMAEFVCVPRSAVHLVPDSIDPAGAAILETLGVAIHAMDLARPRLLESVAVLGCGPVGVLLVQLARLAGAGKIIAIDPVEQRTALACDLGADVACRSYAGVADVTEGRGVDLVIEATELIARFRACGALCAYRRPARSRRHSREQPVHPERCGVRAERACRSSFRVACRRFIRGPSRLRREGRSSSRRWRRTTSRSTRRLPPSSNRSRDEMESSRRSFARR